MIVQIFLHHFQIELCKFLVDAHIFFKFFFDAQRVVVVWDHTIVIQLCQSVTGCTSSIL